MADIAIIANWPLSEMADMELGELIAWHNKLVERWNRINGSEA